LHGNHDSHVSTLGQKRMFIDEAKQVDVVVQRTCLPMAAGRAIESKHDSPFARKWVRTYSGRTAGGFLRN
jgi:hypothetical protein